MSVLTAWWLNVFLGPFSQTVRSSWKIKSAVACKGLKEEDYFEWCGERSRCGETEAFGCKQWTKTGATRRGRCGVFGRCGWFCVACTPRRLCWLPYLLHFVWFSLAARWGNRLAHCSWELVNLDYIIFDVVSRVIEATLFAASATR